MALRRRDFLGLTLNNPRALGSSFAGTYSAARSDLIAELVRRNRLSVQQLSVEDAKAAGPKIQGPKKDVGGFWDTLGRTIPGADLLGKVPLGGLFSNYGEDISAATKGLPAAALNVGKSSAADLVGIADLLTPGLDLPDLGVEGSDVKKNIIDPTIESYKYTYGGVGAPEGSSLLGRIYEHPLGPTLDALAVASLGVGGAIRGGTLMANRGLTNPIARGAMKWNAAERPVIPYSARDIGEIKIGDETIIPEIPGIKPDISRRPLRRGLQRLTDAAAGKSTRIADMQRRMLDAQQMKFGFSKKEADVLGTVKREAATPLVEAFSKLDPDEVTAFELVNRLGGENLGMVSLLERAAREGLEGTEGVPTPQTFGTYRQGVEEAIPQSRTAISDRAKELARDPSQSENLLEALTKYRERIEERVRPDFGDEDFAAKAGETVAALTERFGGKEIVDETSAPGTPPAEALSRFDWNKIKARGEEGDFGRKLDEPSRSEGLYVEDLLRDPSGYVEPGTAPRSAPQSSVGESSHPFAQPTIMPSEVARGFEQFTPNRLQSTLGATPGWRRGKRGTFNPANVTYQSLFEEAPLTLKPNPNPILAGVTRPDARQFVDYIAKFERDKIEKAYNTEQLQKIALKNPETGEPVVVPGNMTQQQIHDMFGEEFTSVSPEGRLRFYNSEVTAAQAIKTMQDMGYEVGSPEMMARLGAEAEDAAISTTVGARHMPAWVIPNQHAEYLRKLETASDPYKFAAFRGMARALNFWRTWTLAMMPRWALNTAVGSTVLTTVKGVRPKDYRMAGKLRKEGQFARSETKGVNLGNVIGLEMLESGKQGVGAYGIKSGPIGQSIMHKVQAIEDYFRRASFVQSLRQEAKAALAESGTIISNFERAKGPKSVDDYVEIIKNQPDTVRRALEQVDRMAYNFATLGPFERRYVRQAIPFWGWYKFISGLAYRLPVDYPGRTNLMAQMGMLATEQTQEQYGAMPPWMAGAIPFGQGKGFGYLSTMGMNPFSQIFNPAGPEGVAAGSLQLGQGSPLIQSILTSYGIDPLRGGEVPFSPEAPYGRDFLSRLWNVETGKESDIHQVLPLTRLLATSLRSFPQARIFERWQSGGRSVYPENIPFLNKQWMPTKEDSRFGAGGPGVLGVPLEVLEQYVGVAPRPYNLERYQRLRKKGLKYARQTRKTKLKAHRKANK